ncbi:MAG: hypothetical protein Kow0026_15730 [Oricola sp.]
MYFLMRCMHHPGMDAMRDTHRAEHRAWVKSGGEGRAVVLIGSALLDENGQAVGNWGILSAKDEESAQAFVEGDAFYRAGIVEKAELVRLPDTFQAHRVSDPMTSQ